MDDPDQRLLSVLLSSLSLPSSEFAPASLLLHRLVASHLARSASLFLWGDGTTKNSASISSSPTSTSLYHAILAVLHRLADLPSSVPITVASLHDFIILYTSSKENNENSSHEIALAKKIVANLLRKKPSLARGIEMQIIPSYLHLLEDLSSQRSSDVVQSMQQARIMLNSLKAVFVDSKLDVLRDLLVHSGDALWVALQTFYDVTLLHIISSLVPPTISAVSGNKVLEDYIHLRHGFLEIFVSFFPTLSTETLLSLLEGEASSPELPDSLISLPDTSFLNLSLLADAEHSYALSSMLNRNKQISEEERIYIEKSLKSTVPEDEEIQDGLELVGSTGSNSKRQGKGRARSVLKQPSGQEDSSTSTEIALIQQVQVILPDIAPEIVQRLLENPSFGGLSDSDKVEKAVGMILEGHPEASLPFDSGLETSHGSSSDYPTKERVSPPSLVSPARNGKSAFAQARANIFEDSIDLSRVLPPRGRGPPQSQKDIANDTFLPPELRNAILAAAERESSDEEEDEDNINFDDDRRLNKRRTAAFVEDLGESDIETRTGAGRVTVKDNIDEESEAEEEQERQHQGTTTTESTSASALASRNHTRPGTPSATTNPGSSSSGLSPSTESRFLALYSSNPTLFSRESRKSQARADLKKETKLSDEQIEGWARILERNPKKDKILAKANEFTGNTKGLEIRSGPTGGGGGQGKKPAAEGSSSSSSSGQGAAAKVPEGDGAGRGRGAGGPGRGRGRGGRGGQSEQRRRGHDKKLAKQGGVVG